ncbi:WecB/TagA/CpsF family glycosyltransferase (plasmid) [Sphingomonas parapaucimobilis]|jgi:N-acetylglucosaminyldiphosphoundecaprenol N-acetyl-beta-D-mannosaminyltransferase
MIQLPTENEASSQRLIFGLNFTPMTQAALVNEVLSTPASEVRMIATCNLDHVVNLHRDSVFRAAYNTAWKITVDGAPVFLYQRLSGGRVPERVTGADFFPALMRGFNATQHRPFYLTSNDEVGRALEADLLSRGCHLDYTPYFTLPFGFERDSGITETILATIEAAAPTHLFLGVGSPKSEKWAAQYRDRLAPMYVLPVGAALEFHVGHKRRAPKLIRRIGLESVWRLLSEPRRLWRRYMLDSWTFIAAIRADRRYAATLTKS